MIFLLCVSKKQQQKKQPRRPPSWFEALIISSNTQQADSNAIASSSDKAASEKLRDEESRGKTALASKSQGSTRLEKPSAVAKEDKAVDAKPLRKEPVKDDKKGVSEPPVAKKKEATAAKATDEELKRKVVEKDKIKERHADDESAKATLHRRRDSVDDREATQTRKKIEKEIEREPGELIEEVEEPKPKSPRTTREKDTGRR